MNLPSSSDNRKFSFISIGCNSKTKTKHWYDIFNSITKNRDDTSCLSQTPFKSSDSLRQSSETKESKNDINHEYYSKKPKFGFEKSDEIPVKLIKISDSQPKEPKCIEIKFNMNSQSVSENQRSRCYSTRVISNDNDVEVKVTTSEPYKAPPQGYTSLVVSKYQYLDQCRKLVDPFYKKGKFSLNKKFESLKKLSQKTKAVKIQGKSLHSDQHQHFSDSILELY